MQWKSLIPVLAGIVSAILIDLNAYQKAVESTPSDQGDPPFKWRLMVVRCVIGACTGLVGILSYEAV